MARPQFESVVAQAPRIQIGGTVHDSTVSVPATSSINIYVYSPPGTVSEVIDAFLEAPIPAGATSGNHLFALAYQLNVGPIFNLHGESTFDKVVRFAYGYFHTATVVQLPADINAQGSILRSYQFDDEMPLAIHYNNRTNVAQNGTRKIRLITRQITTG
jgi:hypothetical protein